MNPVRLTSSRHTLFPLTRRLLGPKSRRLLPPAWRLRSRGLRQPTTTTEQPANCPMLFNLSFCPFHYYSFVTFRCFVSLHCILSRILLMFFVSLALAPPPLRAFLAFFSFFSLAILSQHNTSPSSNSPALHSCITVPFVLCRVSTKCLDRSVAAVRLLISSTIL